MSAANHIYLVADAGTPVTAFTTKRELQAYLWRRLDTSAAPLLLVPIESTHDSGLPRHCLPRRYIGPECAIMADISVSASRLCLRSRGERLGQRL
jgi:hypothetical protein